MNVKCAGRRPMPERHTEAGYGTWELIISLPAVVLLLMVMSWIFLWAYREYRIQSSDWELRQELHLAMERMVEDVHRANRVEASGTGDQTRLTIYRYKDAWRESSIDISQETTRYYIQDTGATSKKLVMDWSSWPLTGDSAFAGVLVHKFVCQREGKILHIELEGISELSGHRCALETDVYLAGGG